MNLYALFFRSRKLGVVDHHAAFYRRPAERVMDPPDPVKKSPRKPIRQQIGIASKAVIGFIANLFLAILAVIVMVMKMRILYLFLSLVSCVCVGALNDINTTNHGTVFGTQVALLIFAVVSFIKFLVHE